MSIGGRAHLICKRPSGSFALLGPLLAPAASFHELHYIWVRDNWPITKELAGYMAFSASPQLTDNTCSYSASFYRILTASSNNNPVCYTKNCIFKTVSKVLQLEITLLVLKINAATGQLWASNYWQNRCFCFFLDTWSGLKQSWCE